MVQEIRCSKLSRTMKCLGYHSLEGLEESETNEAAKEGTAIGELLSEMIRQKTPTPSFGSTASNGFHIDNDMWFYARDTYKTLLETSAGSRIETEERIDWMTTSGIMIRGQFDISYIVGSTLHIEDLKYGWRIVDVKENWQLLGYAIGQVIRLQNIANWTPTHIHLKIHQPRPHHEDGPIRSWVLTYAELDQYVQRIQNRMTELSKGNKTLSTSPSCRYCEGLNVCPAFNRSFYASVESVLGEWKQDVLSNEDISKQLDVLTRVQEIIKIKADSLTQLGVMRISQGQVIPKYSIEQTFGDRRWTKDVSAKSIKTLTGIDITKTELMSPAQAEKAGVDKKLVKELVVRENRGTKLVKKDVTEEANKIFTKPF